MGQIRTYANNRLQPVINPQVAATDVCRLMPGKYSPGQVIGNANFGATPANEVQTVTITGIPTGGTFRLALSAAIQDISGPIAYNTTAAALQALLEAMPSIGVGNVAVTGGPGPGTALVVTFQGAIANYPVPLMTLFANALTGGTAPSVTIAETTVGKSPGGIWLPYNNAAADGSDVAKGALEFPVVVDLFGRHYTGATEVQRSYSRETPYFYKGFFRTLDLIGLDAAGIADLGKIIQGSASALTNPGTILEIV